MSGPRIRSIKPETWDDEAIGRLSFLARLNFYGLISQADDQGRGRAGTTFLMHRLHPHSVSIHGTLMESSLKELEDSGRIQFYSVNGEKFYHVKNFEKHQKINRPSPSALPEPPKATRRSSTQGKVDLEKPAFTEPSLNPPEHSLGIGGDRTGADRRGAEGIGGDCEGAPGSPSATATVDRAEDPDAEADEVDPEADQGPSQILRAEPPPEQEPWHPPGPGESLAEIRAELGLEHVAAPDKSKLLKPDEVETRRQRFKAALATGSSS